MNNSLALNPFKKGKKSEVEGIHKVELDITLSNIIDKFDYMVENKERLISNYKSLIPELTKDIVISPKQIENTLSYLIKNDKFVGLDMHPNYHMFLKDYTLLNGFFISSLIQNSYNAGYNDFNLVSYHTFDICIGRNLKGKKDKYLNISLEGSFGDYCFAVSEYINLVANARMGSFMGSDSKNSKFTVYGNIEDECGRSSKESTFTINGNVGVNFGAYSKKSLFVITGKMGSIYPTHGFETEDSIFKTSNKETYEKMLKNVPESNTIQLLDKNGNLIEEKKI